MKTINGRTVVEIDDHVTITSGPDAGVSGTIIGIAGREITIWGRQPGYLGSKSFRVQVPASSVMYVGRGILRPVRPGETPVPPPNLQAAAESGRGAGVHAPTLHQPKQPPQPAQSQAEAEREAAPSARQLAIPSPKNQDISPEALKPMVVKRESAMDLFGKSNPEAATQQGTNEHKEEQSPQVQAEGILPGDDLLPGEEDLPVRVEGAEARKEKNRKRKAADSNAEAEV